MNETELARAFQTAFTRALEKWVFELRTSKDPVHNVWRYTISGLRNEYNSKNNLRLEWSKP